MKANNNQKWSFFCHVKCMSEKRIARKILKNALFILTGKKVNQLPNNHVVMEVLDDLEYYADSLLRAANPDEAVRIYKNILNGACENVKEKINGLIIQ